MFSRDDILEKPAKKDRNRLVFTIVPEYTDIYANPYSSGKVLAIFFHVRWGWREHCKMQKISSKDLPETPSLSASHLLWKSKNFPWICVKRFNRFHVKCRFSSFFFFCIGALQLQTTSGVTKKVWIPWATDVYVLDNEDSGGVEESSSSASRSIFGCNNSCF